ncbi:TIGR03619 family F420-dependent LLM class oxidoreductase [Nocardia sp. alder85J]|uniref:TIGR03619 family F420-dependent LLM class oxidoreductase n=1 Tax=Nocardia sp. alder85J TaxID=2862949 RepID=UPI001CD31713|nr:TIGR03619 family F420-dependent LLM class oxidoreductase [Nocardia sp. alder85J]MCX4091882.1 TIGR03619 family F420-dependent LLM class oxidoreductase [Nocardia sp. alder85J]
MKFDIILPGSRHLPGHDEWARTLAPAGFRRVLREIDRLRFTTVSVSEHPGIPLAEVPRLGAYWQDALSAMAFAAGVTERVRIDAAVLVLPYHHPLRLAKALATIDVLSDGRLNVSVGVGHAEAEFAALGVPFAQRGALTDEILAALATLWTEDEPEHRGAHFDITGLAVAPRPVQRPGPPVYVGGNSRPALRRAARHDGWQPNPTGLTVAELPPLLDYLRDRPEFAGKAGHFDINWLEAPEGVTPPATFRTATLAELAAYRDQLVAAYRDRFAPLGITRVTVVTPPGVGGESEYLDFLRWFDAEVLPAVPQ